MYIMHIITMVRLALHCFPICSLVVSIMTNSVFLGQAPRLDGHGLHVLACRRTNSEPPLRGAPQWHSI